MNRILSLLLVEEAGVAVERLQLDNMPHGFGDQGDWIPAYAQWLGEVFTNNETKAVNGNHEGNINQ